ncbi:YkvA family protein [Cellulomonas citrea]|uniref:YkvA family protein n=1 Tax=Cellulomonas citrea TaxID=1909423 RepID=UPI00135C83A3|nr:YkvA family protein [Cellulomonas citrea]
MPDWAWSLVGVAGGVLVLWLVLVVVLWVARPDAPGIRALLRLLPDLLRLLRRLAADPTLPRGVRVRLWLLLAYLASPIDLVPDVVPVLGYADDVVVVALVLRSVVRRAGPDAVARHWPGTPDGLVAVLSLAGASGQRGPGASRGRAA